MSGSKAYKDLTLRISTDGASFKSGMRDINRDLAKFRSEFQRTMKNLKVKFDTKDAVSAIKSLSMQVERNKTRIQRYTDQIKQNQENIKALSKQHDELKSAIQRQRILVESLTKEYGKNSEQVKTAKAKLKELESSLKETDKATKNENKSLENNKKYLQNAQLSAAKLADQQKVLNKQLKDLDPSAVNQLSKATVRAAENYQHLKENASRSNATIKDSQQAISALNNLIKQQEQLDKSLRDKANELWKNANKDINTAKDALSKNNNEIKDSIKLENDLRKQLAGLKEGTKEYKDMSVAIQDQERHTSALKASSQRLQDVIKATATSAKSDINQVNDKIKANARAIDHSKSELNTFSSSWRNKFKAMSRSTEGNIKNMGDLTRHVKNLDSGLGQVRFGVFGSLGQHAFSLITRAAGYTKQAIVDGSDQLSNFEKASRALGESDKQIQQEETALQKYAITTRYSMRGMLGLFQQVRGTGVPNAEKLTESIGNIATVTGATTDQVQRFTKDADEAFASGKLQAGQWNGMVRDMPDASAQLRKQIVKDLGITNDQFKEAMRQGKISGGELQKALNEIGQNKSVLKQAKKVTSFKQATDSLNESMQDNLSQLGKRMSGPLTEATQHLADRVDGLFNDLFGNAKLTKKQSKEISEELDKVIDKVFNAAQRLVDYIKRHKSDIKNAIKEAYELLKKLYDFLKPIAKWLIKHRKTVLAFIAAFKGIEVVIGLILTVHNAFLKVKESIEIVKGAWGLLSKTMGTPGLILAGIALVVAALVYFFTQTKTGRKIAKDLAEWFKEAWKKIEDTLKPVIKAVTNFFKTAWKDIKGVWNEVLPYFKAIWNGIKLVFSVVKAVLGTYFKLAWIEIKTVWSVVVGFFKGVWNGIKAVYSVVRDVLGGYFRLAWDTIREIWTHPIQFFRDVFHGITHPFSTISSIFHKYFGDAANDIYNIFNGVVNWFSSLPSRIMGSIGSLGSQIRNSIMSGLGKVGSLIGLSNGFSYQLPTMKLAPQSLGTTKSIYNQGGNTINVYASPNQDVRSLAHEIQTMMIRGV